MLRYLLPSVVDNSGAGIKRTVVTTQEILQLKSKSSEIFKNANILLPSVVDSSGAEIKRTVVSNKKRLNYKSKKVL